MGPGETGRLLEQIKQTEERYDPAKSAVNVPDVTLEESKLEPFRPKFGIQEIKRDRLTSEAHLEASVIANPSLLPDQFAPEPSYSIVRQAPISPLKPMQIDAVDICYYNPQFEDGMYPLEILELKYTEADGSGANPDTEQIQRYRDATDKMTAHHLTAAPDDILVNMLAPSYDDEDFDTTLSQNVIDRVDFRQFEESPAIPSFTANSNSP